MALLQINLSKTALTIIKNNDCLANKINPNQVIELLFRIH